MKVKLLFLIVTISITSIVRAQETPINLIGFQYLQSANITNIIKWQANTPNNLSTTATNVAYILVGNSTFNATSGNFITKVTLTNGTAGILEFNALSDTTEFNSETSGTNGSSECDMQTGNIYTYDNNSQNEKVFKKYNPVTNESTEVGIFNFAPGTLFYPKSSCFDSNLSIYYFIISDSNGLKLVSVPINIATFSYNEVLITGLPVLSNISLEYSNDSDTIFATFFTNIGGQNNVFNVGKLSTTGVLESLSTIPTINGFQLFNGAFDQATNSIIFVGSEQNQTKLFIYNTSTNTYVTKSLPFGNINELECNNYTYSQEKYGPLKTVDYTLENKIMVNPNLKIISFSKELYDHNFDIYSISGAKIISQKVASDLSFDFSNLSSGLYILRFNDTKNTIFKKIILN